MNVATAAQCVAELGRDQAFERGVEHSGDLDLLAGVLPSLAAKALAREEIVKLINRTARETGLSIENVIRLYNEDQIDAPDEVRRLCPTFSPSTFFGWQNRYLKSGGALRALVDKFGNRKGQGEIDRVSGVCSFLEVVSAAHPLWNNRQLHLAVAAEFPTAGISRDMVAEWRRKYERDHRALVAAHLSKKDFKNGFLTAVGRYDETVTRVGQIVEIDSTSLEVHHLDNNGGTGRAWATAAIDRRSRYAVVKLCHAPSAETTIAVALEFARKVSVMETLLSDWGRENLNRHARRALERWLRIDLKKVARPGAPELKGGVERFIQTVVRDCRLLPGYAGSNTPEATAIRQNNAYKLPRGQRRNMVRIFEVELTFEQLEEALQQIVTNYNYRIHSAIGKAPAQMVAEARATGELRPLRQEDDARLALVTGPGGVRAVGKRGLRVGNHFYACVEMVPWIGRMVEYVQLADAGRLAIYSPDETGDFIGIAVAPELAGVSRQVLALAVREAQARYHREHEESTRLFLLANLEPVFDEDYP